MARKGENIFKRKDGRWEGRYIKGHKDGKAVYGYVFGKSYLDVKEKKSKAIATMNELKKSPVPPAGQPLMREIGTKWLDELKPIRKKSTLAKYYYQLENHIYPFFGEIKINEITSEDLITFRNDLLEGGNSGRKLSPKTVSDILSRMKSIHKYAMLRGCEVQYIPECASVPQTAEKTRVLTLEEEELLIRYLKTHPGLISLGILLCLFTGIRLGELCALTWNDISLSEKQLHVRRTMQRLQNMNRQAKERTYINIDEPKSKCSVRTIPLPENIIEEIQSAYCEGAYLLTGQANWFIEPRTMENRFKAILRNCGIENANFHSLRHTFATRCVEVGFDIKSLSEILGHASVNITLNRYVHPTMQLKRENMCRLSGLFTVK